MTLLKRTLQECYSKKKLISISIRKLDVVHIGFIESFDENVLDLAEIDTLGKFEKRTQILIAKIKLIDVDDLYNRDLAIIKRQRFWEKSQPRFIYAKAGLNTSLTQMITNQTIGSFFKGDDYFIGKAVEFDSAFLVINSITYQGLDDGFTIIRISDITKIRTGGGVELKVQFLYKMKNSKTGV